MVTVEGFNNKYYNGSRPSPYIGDYFMRTYYVYIMVNDWITVLYIGITGDLKSRVYQHKKRVKKGFTSRYYIGRLVYYEEFEMAYDAICREKQLKNWHREWKINLIKKSNPTFKDLSESWYGKGDVGDGDAEKMYLNGDSETSSE